MDNALHVEAAEIARYVGDGRRRRRGFEIEESRSPANASCFTTVPVAAT
jgi:hypothetical protein